GLSFNSTNAPTLRAVDASRSEVAVYLKSTTLPATLEDLVVRDAGTGLSMNTVTGAGTLTIDGDVIAADDRAKTTVLLTTATPVTVDTAALGLVQSGNSYISPPPPSDPICGTTITSDLVLMADLDCSETTTTAITLGADGVKVLGNGFRILAPRASRVIEAVNRNGVVIDDVDVSSPYPVALSSDYGVYVSGGTGNRISRVRADRHGVGVYVSGADLHVGDVTANGCTYHGLRVDQSAAPIELTGITATGGATGVYLSDFDGDDGAGGRFTLDGGVLADVGGNRTALQLVNVRNVIVQGPIATLDGAVYGVHAGDVTNANLAFRDLDVSDDRGDGTGLLAYGDGTEVTRVTANRRATGVDVRNGAGVVLTDVAAAECNKAAAHLEAVTVAALTNLSLTVSYVGLELQTLDDPTLVVDPYDDVAGAGAIASLAGCDTSIFGAAVTGVTFRGLALDGRATGLALNYATNAGLTLEDLDLSGDRYSGTGASLNGSGHVVSGITVSRRDTGFNGNQLTEPVIADVTVDRVYTTGILLQNSETALDLSNLAITRTATALWLKSITADAATPLVIDGDVLTATDDTAIAIDLDSVANVIVEDLTLPSRTYGVDGSSGGNTGVTVRRVDVSGTRGVGYGLRMNGAGVVIEDLDARYRSTGVLLGPATGLAVSGVRARNASSYGVNVNTISDFVLEDLDVGASYTGLYLQNLAGTVADPVVIDAWDGTRGVLRDASDCATTIAISNGDDIRFDHLRLDGFDNGVDGTTSSNERLVFDGVDASGGRSGATGYGLHLGGTEHVLTGATISRRAYALRLNGVSGATVTDLTATGNGTGYYVVTLAANQDPPTLSNLDLRDNGAAFYLNNWKAPFVFEPSLGIDVSGSDTGFQLYNQTQALTFRDLDLTENLSAAITTSTNISNIAFERLDVSGVGLGYGLDLSASTGVTITDVVASDRYMGVRATGCSALVVDGLDASNAAYGFRVDSLTTGIAPTLSNLHLTDNSYGLTLYNVRTPLTIDEDTGLDVSGSAVGIYLTNYTQDVTVAGLRLDNPSFGVTVVAYSRAVTLRDLDVSGSGRGRGLNVEGVDHVVSGIVARDREYGIYGD
ncbi:MAG: hypothetical protein KC635_05355, partial [Myxococcales bacterium]|nr:hypothetical protein [Myxococcales bacterium]